MSCTAFIEPLPVIEFAAQILGKDTLSRPLSDADRIKVVESIEMLLRKIRAFIAVDSSNYRIPIHAIVFLSSGFRSRNP